jgi:hydroxyacylglutathione hydrolase
MQVTPIPCLKDNYAYLLLDGRNRAVVIDPSEPEPVEAALARASAELAAIWLTHHHFDHVGGVEALCACRGPIPVLGSAYDLEHARIPRQTRGLSEADRLRFDDQPVQLLEIPGHTLGAIAYVVDECLFSGDTLFTGGCGRVFEGTMAMMQASLAKLRALPASTRLYCGHEYTAGNLRFAQTIEPEADAIAKRLAWAIAKREQGEPTVPSLLADELTTNPFMRWDAPRVVAAARERGATDDSPASVFAALRKAKDSF